MTTKELIVESMSYELDLDRGEYVVRNASGTELAAFDWETEARRFCEEIATSQYAPVGAVVLCGYWGTRYRVLTHIPSSGDWRGDRVRIEWLDGPSAGRVAEHSTPFDPKRDRIERLS